MSQNNNALTLPAFGKVPQLNLELNNIIVAEQRLHEVKTVNPITYVELEHTFNEAYRDLKKHLSSIGYQITQVENILEQAKADVILGTYPEFMKDKPKTHDNADMRKAFLVKDEAYNAALEKLNQLKAIQSHFEGKIKVIENTCRYMRQQMQLIIRSGLSNADLYNTNK